jgi:hypothetical protein
VQRLLDRVVAFFRLGDANHRARHLGRGSDANQLSHRRAHE